MDNNKIDDLFKELDILSSINAASKGFNYKLPDELHMFMDALFAKKRLLILKVSNNKNDIIIELKDYCTKKRLDVCELDSGHIKADDIKGEWEIVLRDGMPYSDRKTPYYISGNRQMIIVEGMREDTGIEVLRSFMYMASLEVYYDDIGNLPKDKLPYGSAYVFIAENGFPLEKFESISSYWKDEAAILDLSNFQTNNKGCLE